MTETVLKVVIVGLLPLAVLGVSAPEQMSREAAQDQPETE